MNVVEGAGRDTTWAYVRAIEQGWIIKEVRGGYGMGVKAGAVMFGHGMLLG